METALCGARDNAVFQAVPRWTETSCFGGVWALAFVTSKSHLEVVQKEEARQCYHRLWN